MLDQPIPKKVKIRDWRTRKDPFKEVWVDVLLAGFKENRILLQKNNLNVFRKIILEDSLMGNYEHCNEEYENGGISWPKNLFISAWI